MQRDTRYRPPSIWKDTAIAIVVIAIVIAAAAMFAPGQEPMVMPRIDGASAIDPKSKEDFRVVNLAMPPIDDIKQLRLWAAKVKVAVDAPDSAKPVNIACEIPLSVGIGPESIGLRITLQAETPGIYVIIFHDGNAGVVAFKRVTVGAGVPTPNPQPGPGPNQPGPPSSPSQIRKVVMVYEKDQTQLSPSLLAAIHQLNVGGSGVVASVFEVDSTNGDRQIPKQFATAVAAARAAGLPALVSVDANDVVFRTVRNPSTEAQLKEVLGQ